MSKRVDHPIILGIVGDSASGKSTLSVGVAQILGEAHCTVICTDDYHRYDRKARAAAGLSALDPRANYVDVLEQHLRLLRAGEPILKPVYDHRQGTFEPPEYVRPKEFVIAEGLLGYTTRTMRDCYDVKIYLDPEEELRVRWKMHRDTTKRGYTRDGALWEWFGKIASGTPDRRTVTIVLKNEARQDVMRWHALDAWINKIEGPTFKASGNEVAMESVELVHEGLIFEIATTAAE